MASSPEVSRPPKVRRRSVNPSARVRRRPLKDFGRNLSGPYPGFAIPYPGFAIPYPSYFPYPGFAIPYLGKDVSYSGKKPLPG